jgi:glucosamine kinase
MQLFLGVDGGGSHTRAAVIDAEGRQVGRGDSGLGNLHHATEEAVGENLAAALRGALSALPTGTPFRIVSAFFGMAGVTSPSTADRFRRLAARIGLEHAVVGVDHDIRIALAGGLAGRPGIALIVGTGSSCYGRTADGRTCQTGGWGSLVADEGSGYDLGRRALVAAVRMSDGRQPMSPLRDRVFAWLRVRDVSQVLERLYEQGLERNEIAAFAPEVVRLAEGGDGPANAILEAGAADLADMVAANHRQLPTAPQPEVVITGGLGTAPTHYRTLLRQAIAVRVPGARVLPEAEFEPVLGAALLALSQAGIELAPERIRHLRGGVG